MPWGKQPPSSGSHASITDLVEDPWEGGQYRLDQLQTERAGHLSQPGQPERLLPVHQLDQVLWREVRGQEPAETAGQQRSAAEETSLDSALTPVVSGSQA